MPLKTELLKADGYSEEEIKQIQIHCDVAEATGRFSHDAAVIWINGGKHVCSRTIAAIMNKVRPGCWLDNPAEGKKKAKKKSRNKRSNNLIKVYCSYSHVQRGGPAGEFLWARQISKNTAKIDSIPFGTGRLACGDLVRITKNNEVTEVLEHVAKTRSLIYADMKKQTPDEIARRYAEIQQELKEHDIYAEAMFAGTCSISVPKDMDEDELERIMNRLDVQMFAHEDELE